MENDAPQPARYRYHLVTALGLAMDSIRAHKLRSFLTLLGVIIGVASVVLVGSAIEGLGTYAEESTSKVFGSDTYLIAQIAGATTSRDLFERMRRNKPIRPADVAYLKSVTGDQVIYSPYNQRTEDVKAEGLIIENSSILGVAAVMPNMRDITLTDGRFFTEQEERTSRYVAVIGQDVVAALFPNVMPLGRTIKIRGYDFTVIGVQERLGSTFGRSQDNVVYIPFTVFTRMYGGGNQSVALFGRARPGSNLSLEDALDITRVALRTRFHERPGEADRFDVMTPDSMRSLIDRILGMISAVVVPVTAISLVVGGIVIMNIMLVSVTERTHEIGIRKSVGARPADIRLQFLVEAVLLAAFGGAIGLGIGWGLAALLSAILKLTLTVTLPYVLLALFVSSAVGIVSGWYPAMRAARLDPIEALRTE
jgi:putative ABC transport system permease protein